MKWFEVNYFADAANDVTGVDVFEIDLHAAFFEEGATGTGRDRVMRFEVPKLYWVVAANDVFKSEQKRCHFI